MEQPDSDRARPARLSTIGASIVEPPNRPYATGFATTCRVRIIFGAEGDPARTGALMPMAYRIAFHDDEKEIDCRMEPGDFDVAKAHAREGLVLPKATSVRILDGNDREVWSEGTGATEDGAPRE